MTARQIAPATGKLGVLTPGMGAVASTFIAGVIAARKGLPPAEFEVRLEDWRTRLFSEREGRVRPLGDDKVLAGWNGAAIGSITPSKTTG